MTPCPFPGSQSLVFWKQESLAASSLFAHDQNSRIVRDESATPLAISALGIFVLKAYEHIHGEHRNSFAFITHVSSVQLLGNNLLSHQERKLIGKEICLGYDIR